MLDLRFKNLDAPFVRPYLSENDLAIEFSTLHKLYYGGLRPILPISARQLLQKVYNGPKTCRANFIWPDLVELMKRDEEGWERFTSTLYPPGHVCAVVLTHDVETQQGYDFIPEVIRLEARYGLRSSWNLVACKYKLHQPILDCIRENGHEIGIHGYNHDGTLYYSRDRFRQRAVHINRALQQHGAVGFRSPQVHRNLTWLQELDVLYDASCFDYDPYQPFPGGTGSIWPFMAGRFVELPYTLPQDHTLWHALGMRDNGIWIAKTRWLVANRGMVLVLTHPDYLMERDGMKLYESFLEHLRRIPRAWHCLPREMAARYAAL